MLTYKDGTVKFVVFTDDTIMTVVFVISVTTIILANIHVLILLNLVLFMMVLIFAIACAIAVFLSPILLFVYFPLVGCLGYSMIFYEAKTSTKKKYEMNDGNSLVTVNPSHKPNDHKNDIALTKIHHAEMDP